MSVTSGANEKDGNEMNPGVVHRTPGICLTAEENPGKSQLGDRLMKGLCDSNRLKWGPFPLNKVGRIAQLTAYSLYITIIKLTYLPFEK